VAGSLASLGPIDQLDALPGDPFPEIVELGRQPEMALLSLLEQLFQPADRALGRLGRKDPGGGPDRRGFFHGGVLFKSLLHLHLPVVEIQLLI
jgi:hypothetical protein